MVRYAGEHANDTGASTLDRPIGSASQRQASINRYQSVVGIVDAHPVADAASTRLDVSFSTFHNAIEPVAAGPQLTFPSMPGRRVVPRAAGHDAEAVPGRRHRHVRARRAHAPRRRRVAARHARFDLGVFRDGRVELVEDFADFDHNGDGRVDDDDLLFAVTLRSGKPDQALMIPDANNNYVALFVQDDWRVRPRPDAEPRASATSSTPT